VPKLEFANGAEPSNPVSRLSSDWFSGDLIETLPAAVYVCNAEAVVVAYNRRAAELWGRAPSAGDNDEKYCGAHKLFRPEGTVLPHSETPMEWVLRTGKPARDMEVIIERPDTSRVTVLVNIAPLFCNDGKLVGAVNCFQDLSAHERAERERARLVEELHQAKKMEAIGQLTAGVAHDFNNLLTAILGNLEMLESRTEETGSLKLLGNAAQSVRRGERLTGQLLAFARKQTLLPKAVDLNHVVADMSNLLQTSIGTMIRFETRTQPGLWPALVDPNQIELVLLNLAINARDAMPRRHIDDRNKQRDTEWGRSSGGFVGRRVCGRIGERHRDRHERRSAREGVRALLHHQGDRQGVRSRPQHGARRGKAIRRYRADHAPVR
jgi:nitrogen-specific signal transduction histidine kinase